MTIKTSGYDRKNQSLVFSGDKKIPIRGSTVPFCWLKVNLFLVMQLRSYKVEIVHNWE